MYMLLTEKLKDKRLILASRSPRRRELMSGCGLQFELADGYEVEEIYPPETPAREVPEYLARLKSDAYPKPLAENDVLISADTVVILEGHILGKPESREKAVEMLSALSGSRHTVVTGVVLRTQGRVITFSSSTDVWFRLLRPEEIDYYVDTYRPYDKAGAYGIQEWIGYAGIERIEGSFYNVMGLPIQQLYVTLQELLDEQEK